MGGHWYLSDFEFPHNMPLRKEPPVSGVYLIHFSRKYKHAGHYLGWAKDIEARIGEHKNGTGARLTAVAAKSGIEFTLARYWPNATRHDEYKLKGGRGKLRRGSLARLCPICKARKKMGSCFMCGDIYCPNCGPAQGNTRCIVCGEWTRDGGCKDPSYCETVLALEEEIRKFEEIEKAASAYD